MISILQRHAYRNVDSPWRLEHRPQNQQESRRLGHSPNGIARRRPEHKDHVWCWGFIHDRDEAGRPLK